MDMIAILDQEIRAAQAEVNAASLKLNTLVRLRAKYVNQADSLSKKPKPVAAAAAMTSVKPDDFNKTALVIDAVRKANDGTTPAEIVSALATVGIEIKVNYVYAILGRFRAKGTVINKGGKWYAAAPSLPLAAND